VGGPPNGLVLLGRESGSMAREGKGKTWPNSVVRERKEIFLVPLGQLDPLLLPKILGAVIFSYKT
jgi:hypothetical protein